MTTFLTTLKTMFWNSWSTAVTVLALVHTAVIVMAGHYIWMAILYGFAGVYSGRSAIEVVKHYGPAYLTSP